MTLLEPVRFPWESKDEKSVPQPTTGELSLSERFFRLPEIQQMEDNILLNGLGVYDIWLKLFTRSFCVGLFCGAVANLAINLLVFGVQALLIGVATLNGLLILTGVVLLNVAVALFVGSILLGVALVKATAETAVVEFDKLPARHKEAQKRAFSLETTGKVAI